MTLTKQVASSPLVPRIGLAPGHGLEVETVRRRW